MNELANCVNCGSVFVKITRDICQECYKEEEAAFQIVYKFLLIRKNRQATIPEIVDETGVDEDLIFKFIKEKRLRASDFPNLAYPCESCSSPITEGKLCGKCKADLQVDLEKHEKLSALQSRNSEKEATESIYYAFDNERHKRK